MAFRNTPESATQEQHAGGESLTIIKTYNEKNKNKLQRDLLIRESLEIKKNDSIEKSYNDPQ